MTEKLATLGMVYVPFLFALCFHEFAHGWMAKRLGDPTAEMMGRLNMNPMSHIDWIGTVILPIAAILFPMGIFFGWAKPVPYNRNNLENPKSGEFWIAAAGPLSNVLLAIVATVLLGLSPLFGEAALGPARPFFTFFIQINLFLAVFNLIPIHPLDGGKVLARFIPDELNRKLEMNQQMLSIILLILILSGGIRFLAVPVFWAQDQLMGVAQIIAQSVL